MWDNINVGQFQQIYDITAGQNFEHEFERQIKLLSVIDGQPLEYFEGLALVRLKEECKRTRFLSLNEMPLIAPPKEVSFPGGKKFRILYEFNEITGGQFIDVMTSAKDADQHILNLDKTLAAICVPVVKGKVGKYGDVPFYEVCDLMLTLPIIQANSIAVFFYRVWNAFLKAIPDCLQRKREMGKELTIPEAIALAAAFHSDGDGSIPLHRWLSWNESHSQMPTT